MGKSTLINILSQEKNIYEKYKILKIDLNLTRNCCIKNIFTLIVGLHDNEKTPKDQKMDENEAFSLLMGNYAENAEMIAETMMKLYDTSHPYLFVIDDAQKIDRAYITLFNELNERAEKEKDQPVLVRGHNHLHRPGAAGRFHGIAADLLHSAGVQAAGGDLPVPAAFLCQ